MPIFRLTSAVGERLKVDDAAGGGDEQLEVVNKIKELLNNRIQESGANDVTARITTDDVTTTDSDDETTTLLPALVRDVNGRSP